jgi:plastocyanin
MRRLTILLVGAMLVVAGCGGDDEKPASSSKSDSTPTPTATATEAASGGGGGGGEGGGEGENITIAADKSALKFDKSTLDAKAGKVTITMDNPSDIPHAVAIEGNGVDVDGKTVGKGEKSVASADLKPGTYEFYCPVPGHKEAGMEGKLTVK